MGHAIPLSNLFTAFFHRSREKERRRLTPEDAELVHGLETVKYELENLHDRFDQTTDVDLLDALIYERKAAELKYKYYISQMKERGIVQG